jgi:hypothetical protein
MKKTILKAKKGASHAKSPHAAPTKRCADCGASPCACPDAHDLKK